MLKLTKPLTLKNKNIVCAGDDSFYNRISENYEMIKNNISSTDLLHAFTQPPEVFLAEGETTNIINNNISVENVQTRKLEILNNLINRIMISDQSDFTYQDRVYISSVLNKLGIRDERSFMQRVSEFFDETKLTYQQNQVLAQSINELKRISENNSTINVSKGESGQEALESKPENNYYLHSDIFNRVNLSENAEFIKNMTTNPVSDARIEYREILSAESLRVAEHITLHNYHNMLTQAKTPMVFNHENYYEEYNDEEAINLEEKLTQNISEAMLLSYIDNLYQVRVAKFHAGQNRWYNSVNSIYKSVENTVARYTQNLVSPISNEILTEFHTAEVNNFANVKNTLNTYVDQARTVYLQNNEIINNDYDEKTSNVNRYEQNTQKSVTSIDDRVSNIENTVNTVYNDTVNNVENIANVAQIINQITNSENTQISNESVNNYSSESSQNIVNNNYENNEEVNLSHINNSDVYNNSTEYTDEQIMVALQKIEQHNIENQNQYIRALQNLSILQNNEVKPDTSKERQKAESLAALNDPQTLILNYREEARADSISDDKRRMEAIESLPPDVRTFVQLADRFLYHPSAEDRKLLGSDPLSALNRDIQAVEMEKLRVNPPQSETEIRHLDQNTATELIENITNTAVVRNNIENRVDERIEKISFVHKESAFIDEEEISQRFEQLKSERTENQVVTNVVNETKQVINKTEIAKEIINEVVESDRVVRMVSQNVADQLGSISDQVYQRLERKLTNEKRRRGL